MTGSALVDGCLLNSPAARLASSNDASVAADLFYVWAKGHAMNRLLRRLFWDEDGPTAVEYAVMLALIVGLCVGAITFLGTQTTAAFEDSNTKINAAVAGS